jgi:hypothetical protein
MTRLNSCTVGAESANFAQPAWGNVLGNGLNWERALKARLNPALNRPFSAGICLYEIPAALPQANMTGASLAPNDRSK